MPKKVMCKNCNNYRCDWCEKVVDSPDPNMLRTCQYFWERTNADRIRSMNDEELAKWLLDVMKHKVACFGEGAFKYTPCRNVEHDCVKCGVAWLQQHAEVQE